MVTNYRNRMSHFHHMVENLGEFLIAKKKKELSKIDFDYSRSQREQELDYFQRKKFGQLSDKVTKRIEKYHAASRTDLSLSTDQQQTILIEPSQ